MRDDIRKKEWAGRLRAAIVLELALLLAIGQELYVLGKGVLWRVEQWRCQEMDISSG